jgi:hypothetical protein
MLTQEALDVYAEKHRGFIIRAHIGQSDRIMKTTRDVEAIVLCKESAYKLCYV